VPELPRDPASQVARLRAARDAHIEAERKALAELREAKRRQRDAITRRLRRAEHELGKRLRREDTRRKILAGAWLLAEIEREPAFRERIRRELDGFLAEPRDRALFADLFGPPPEGESHG